MCYPIYRPKLCCDVIMLCFTEKNEHFSTYRAFILDLCGSTAYDAKVIDGVHQFLGAITGKAVTIQAAQLKVCVLCLHEKT